MTEGWKDGETEQWKRETEKREGARETEDCGLKTEN